MVFPRILRGNRRPCRFVLVIFLTLPNSFLLPTMIRPLLLLPCLRPMPPVRLNGTSKNTSVSSRQCLLTRRKEACLVLFFIESWNGSLLNGQIRSPWKIKKMQSYALQRSQPKSLPVRVLPLRSGKLTRTSTLPAASPALLNRRKRSERPHSAVLNNLLQTPLQYLCRMPPLCVFQDGLTASIFSLTTV